ncbi:Holin of 3TMs, for gene-transfer release [uncultured Caudovirales phage]|uniref:Holin of 3TMs, for gene-transfer release n=1 Tax=uncultured Caudovirales phage TaxID=2100421 RepID=A0A6J5PT36_9CAUD|nr:Holin of 3TMs, for gene-transfer release [uncultured Caudovirales phage]CAB4172415.1 Holin of 3TMs, for gene-transfer release [uncultured Caudovirales phage]
MAIGIDDAIASASALFTAAISRIWPDPQDRAKAEAISIQATADAALSQMRQSMSLMLAEAQSTDRWTSRARPTMMYVMYVMILAAIPMGVLWAIEPVYAERVSIGMQKWLAAIPDSLWNLFAFCFCGYTVSRTFEKTKGVAQ